MAYYQVKSKEERKWYISEAIKNGWSRPVIIHQIASKLYERQALLEDKTTNFEHLFDNDTYCEYSTNGCICSH